jgi:hypothetical protein
VKPSENDLRPETNPSDATGLEASLESWERRVRQALHRDDKDALRKLFAELAVFVPPEGVSNEWMRVMSGWDARAKTG